MQVADPNARFLSAFLDYLKVEKGLAPLSVSAYRSDLEQYAEFVGKRKRTVKEARRQDVRDFLNALFSNGVDGRSVARKLSALRHLYKYLLLDRYIEKDPTLNIDTPRQWKVLPKSLAPMEVEQVLQGPPRAKHDRMSQALSVRDRAMFEVFYAGALRVSELINVKLEDLKLELGYVLVRGKGDKERIVPLGAAAQEMVQTYLRDARPVLGAGKSSPASVHRSRSQAHHAAAGVAAGECDVRQCGTSRLTAHAAPQLRNSYGGERRRPAHGADHPRPCRHLDHAGVHPPGARSPEPGASRASPAGEARCRQSGRVRMSQPAATTVEKAAAKFIRALQERNASPHTVKAYTNDLAGFAEYIGPQGWGDIDHVLIRSYLSNLYERGLSKTSVARSLAALALALQVAGAGRRRRAEPGGAGRDAEASQEAAARAYG